MNPVVENYVIVMTECSVIRVLQREFVLCSFGKDKLIPDNCSFNWFRMHVQRKISANRCKARCGILIGILLSPTFLASSEEGQVERKEFLGLVDIGIISCSSSLVLTIFSRVCSIPEGVGSINYDRCPQRGVLIKFPDLCEDFVIEGSILERTNFFYLPSWMSFPSLS